MAGDDQWKPPRTQSPMVTFEVMREHPPRNATGGLCRLALQRMTAGENKGIPVGGRSWPCLRLLLGTDLNTSILGRVDKCLKYVGSLPCCTNQVVAFPDAIAVHMYTSQAGSRRPHNHLIASKCRPGHPVLTSPYVHTGS